MGLLEIGSCGSALYRQANLACPLPVSVARLASSQNCSHLWTFFATGPLEQNVCLAKQVWVAYSHANHADVSELTVGDKLGKSALICWILSDLYWGGAYVCSVYPPWFSPGGINGFGGARKKPQYLPLPWKAKTLPSCVWKKF